MKPDPMIRTGTRDDLSYIRDLLQRAQLPVADLESSEVAFLVADLDGIPVGAVGLQIFGASALLRSLVVSDDRRNTGLGRALLSAAEDMARRMQVRELVLLTTSAGPWFARHGYAGCDRAQIAEAIRSSAEFTSLCPASALCMSKPLTDHGSHMTRNVLFLCTGNSARSVLAEATLRAWGGDHFSAFSAGSQPTGQINPFALAQLQAEGMPIEALRSKSWDEFVDAAPMDLVITVCDAAAAEACPVVFGDFIRSHWGLPDPAAVAGSDADKAAAFALAHAIVKTRLRALLALPESVWSEREALQHALDRIGQLLPTDGAQ